MQAFLLNIEEVQKHLLREGEGVVPDQVLADQKRIVLSRCGTIDPASLQEYLGTDGYTALDKVLRSMKPKDVIDEVLKSGLPGRGGGGFPTGKNWQFVAAQPPGDKYVICNAAEGDPGAFMDRSTLEGDPFAVLEGMIVAGYSSDVMAYVPSHRVLKEGGYEAVDSTIYYGVPGPWAEDVEDRIFTGIREVVKRVRR